MIACRLDSTEANELRLIAGDVIETLCRQHKRAHLEMLQIQIENALRRIHECDERAAQGSRNVVRRTRAEMAWIEKGAKESR
jgi:predicted component of type VI protein secretion system